MDFFTLLEFNRRVKQELNNSFPESYWIVAEINELSINGGHCYLELIEKDTQSLQIVARVRANIWAYHFRMLIPYFESVTGQRMAAGMKIMFKAGILFHEVYGLSLQVTDINPAYTVGELALQKQDVIRKLKEDGVFEMNRELEIPGLPQRIAVISSQTAAGYGDFCDQLLNNPYKYQYRISLFPAIMQGNEAEASIVRALENVYTREDEFDLVVIIRGGGSQSDLNCFNSYHLAGCIAQFPLPILTGIGHERDETIADLVACRSLKTPTAVAEFLVSQALSYNERLNDLSLQLRNIVTAYMQGYSKVLRQVSQQLQDILNVTTRRYNKELDACYFGIKQSVLMYLTEKRSALVALSVLLQSAGEKMSREKNDELLNILQKIKQLPMTVIATQKDRAGWLESKCNLLDPINQLRRGYSITKSDGKVIRSVHDLSKGKVIETVLPDGYLTSTVDRVNDWFG